MKSIRRTEEPDCLRRMKKKRSAQSGDWNLYKHKDEIRSSLFVMQKKMCAYCESPLVEKETRIDHFIARHIDASKTFDWNNLFLSCACKDCCDQYKGSHDASNVFKPDTTLGNLKIEDCYVYLESGMMRVKGDLPPSIHKKAENTINLFNLNCVQLIRKRKALWDSLKFYKEYFGGDVDICILDEIVQKQGFESVCEYWKINYMN